MKVLLCSTHAGRVERCVDLLGSADSLSVSLISDGMNSSQISSNMSRACCHGDSRQLRTHLCRVSFKEGKGDVLLPFQGNAPPPPPPLGNYVYPLPSIRSVLNDTY